MGQEEREIEIRKYIINPWMKISKHRTCSYSYEMSLSLINMGLTMNHDVQFIQTCPSMSMSEALPMVKIMVRSLTMYEPIFFIKKIAVLPPSCQNYINTTATCRNRLLIGEIFTNRRNESHVESTIVAEVNATRCCKKSQRSKDTMSSLQSTRL